VRLRLERVDVASGQESAVGHLAALDGKIGLFGGVSMQSRAVMFDVDDWDARVYQYLPTAVGLGYARALSGEGWLCDMGFEGSGGDWVFSCWVACGKPMLVADGRRTRRWSFR